MISKITLHNFQSHKDSALDFSKGVNIIVGNSDSGKSAIIRAINLIVNNRPSGWDYKSYWADETIVEGRFDSSKIIRQRSKKENLYHWDEKKYEGFSQDVPEDIKKEINFSDINFQYQMDSPFLLSKSSGEIAKHINEIMNLDLIDNSLSRIESMKRKFTSDLEKERQTLKEKQDNISRYNYIEEAEKIISYAEKIENRIEENIDKKNNLSSLYYEIVERNIAKKHFEKTINQESKVDDLLILSEEIKYKQKSRDKLKEYFNIDEELRHKKSNLNALINIESKVNECLSFDKRIKENKEKEKNFQKIIDSIVNQIEMICDLNEEISEKEKEFNEKMPDICPLCGRKQ